MLTAYDVGLPMVVILAARYRLKRKHPVSIRTYTYQEMKERLQAFEGLHNMLGNTLLERLAKHLILKRIKAANKLLSIMESEGSGILITIGTLPS